MKIQDIENMTDKERHAISMQKNKKGCATSDALLVQKWLYNQAHPFYASRRCPPEVCSGKGG